jgi:hypothetical protein
MLTRRAQSSLHPNREQEETIPKTLLPVEECYTQPREDSALLHLVCTTSLLSAHITNQKVLSPSYNHLKEQTTSLQQKQFVNEVR